MVEYRLFVDVPGKVYINNPVRGDINKILLWLENFENVSTKIKDPIGMELTTTLKGKKIWSRIEADPEIFNKIRKELLIFLLSALLDKSKLL